MIGFLLFGLYQGGQEVTVWVQLNILTLRTSLFKGVGYMNLFQTNMYVAKKACGICISEWITFSRKALWSGYVCPPVCLSVHMSLVLYTMVMMVMIAVTVKYTLHRMHEEYMCILVWNIIPRRVTIAVTRHLASNQSMVKRVRCCACVYIHSKNISLPITSKLLVTCDTKL
jgi:hypothetical protein